MANELENNIVEEVADKTVDVSLPDDPEKVELSDEAKKAVKAMEGRYSNEGLTPDQIANRQTYEDNFFGLGDKIFEVDHEYGEDDMQDEAHNYVFKEQLRRNSDKYTFDSRLSNIMVNAPDIDIVDAKKFVFNRQINEVSKILDSGRQDETKALSRIRFLQNRIKEDPTDILAIEELSDMKVKLRELGRNRYDRMLTPTGEYVNQVWESGDKEYIEEKAQEYSSWNAEDLVDLYNQKFAEYKFFTNYADKRYDEINKEVEGEASLFSSPLAISKKSGDTQKVLGRNARKTMRELYALHDALILNRDPAVLKQSLGGYFGRGFKEATKLEEYITTDSELRENFADVVRSSGGQLTQEQSEAMTTSLMDKSAMTLGGLTPIILEQALLAYFTGGFGNATVLQNYIRGARTAMSARFGKTGVYLFDAIKAGTRESIIFGATSSEDVKWQHGAGIGFASSLMNFRAYGMTPQIFRRLLAKPSGMSIVGRGALREEVPGLMRVVDSPVLQKGLNVGRVRTPEAINVPTAFGKFVAKEPVKFISKTAVGTAGGTIAAYSGQFVEHMTENGYDIKKAFRDSFGTIPDEDYENFLITVITMAPFAAKNAAKEWYDNARLYVEEVKDHKTKQRIYDIMDEAYDQTNRVTTVEEVKARQVREAAKEGEQPAPRTAEDLPPTPSPKSTEVSTITPKPEVTPTEPTKVKADAKTVEAKAPETVPTERPVTEEVQPVRVRDVEQVEVAKEKVGEALKPVVEKVAKKQELTPEETKVYEENKPVVDAVVETIPTKEVAPAEVKPTDVTVEPTKVAPVEPVTPAEPTEVAPTEPTKKPEPRTPKEDEFDITIDLGGEKPKVRSSQIRQEHEALETSVKGIKDDYAKTYAKATTGTAAIADPTVPTTAKQFVDYMNRASSSLRGLNIKGQNVRPLINEASNIARRIAQAEARGNDFVLSKGQQIPFNEFVESFNAKLDKVVERARENNLKAIKAQVNNQIKDLKKRSIKKVGTKKVGQVEPYAQSYFNTAKDIISAKEGIETKLNDAFNIINSGEPAEVGAYETALGTAKAFGDMAGYEGWDAKQFLDFSNKLKQVQKEGRKSVRAKAEAMKARRVKIRETVDTNIDMTNVPKSIADKLNLDAKQRGELTADEAANRNFFQKAKAGLSHFAVTDAQGKVTFKSLYHTTNSSFNTLMSVFDGTPGVSAGEGKISKLVGGAIKEANRNYLAMKQAYDTNFMMTAVEIMLPDARASIEGAYGKGVLGTAKKILGIKPTDIIKVKEKYEKGLKQGNEALRLAFVDAVQKEIASKELSITIGEGPTTQKINIGNAMVIYAHSLIPENRLVLETANKITESDITKVKGYLGPKLIDFVEKTTGPLMKAVGTEINKKNIELLNIDLGIQDNYYPKKVFSDIADTDLAQGTNTGQQLSAFSAGFIRERVDTKTPIDISGDKMVFVSTAMTHIEAASKFVNYADAIQTVNTVLNSKNMNALLRSKGLQGAAKVLAQQSLRMPTQSSLLQVPGFSKFLQRLNVARVALKPIQVAKQASSWPAAYDQFISLAKKAGVDPGLATLKFLAQGSYDWAKTAATVGLVNPRINRAIREMYELSPVVRDRIDAQMIDIDFGTIGNPKPWQKLTRAQKVSEMAKWSTKVGDIHGIMIGYYQVYEMALKVYKGDKQKAVRELEEYDATQQSRNPFNKTIPQMDKASLTNGATQFKSSQTNYLNQCIQAGASVGKSYAEGGLKAIKKRDLAKLIVNWAAMGASFAAIESLTKLLTQDDEEGFFVSVGKGALLGPFEAMFVIGYFAELIGNFGEAYVKRELKGEKQKALQYFDPALLSDPQSAYADVLKIAERMARKGATEEDIIKAMATAGDVSGMPVSTVVQMTQGLVSLGDGDIVKGILELHGYTDWAIEGEEKKKKKTTRGGGSRGGSRRGGGR